MNFEPCPSECQKLIMMIPSSAVLTTGSPEMHRAVACRGTQPAAVFVLVFREDLRVTVPNKQTNKALTEATSSSSVNSASAFGHRSSQLSRTRGFPLNWAQFNEKRAFRKILEACSSCPAVCRVAARLSPLRRGRSLSASDSESPGLPASV